MGWKTGRVEERIGGGMVGEESIRGVDREKGGREMWLGGTQRGPGE